MKKVSQKNLLTIILLLALCVFGLVNVCARIISERYHPALDLTEDKLYALSDTTRHIVANTMEETNLYVFSAEADYPAMLREMLIRFTQLSPLVHVTYVDPAENPVMLTHYQQMGAQISPLDMLMEGAKRIKAITYQSLILYDGEQPAGIDLEQQLSSALLYVNSQYTPSVVFTTGHGERHTTALQKLFTDNNFSLETKAIAVEEIGQPDVMVIAGPAFDWTQESIARLQTYVDGGGKLMVFLEPTSVAMPLLGAFLEQWGMAVESDIVFEPKAYAAGATHNIIPMYTSSAVNSYFADHPVYVVMPSASSIRVDGIGAQLVEPLLRTTSDAYAKTDLAYTSSQQSADDTRGPFIVAALSGETVFLASSRMIYADDLMGMDSYANRVFLSQVLGALWQESITLSIPAKAIMNAPLPITGEQARVIAIALALVLPLIALFVGVMVKLRRRSL